MKTWTKWIGAAILSAALAGAAAADTLELKDGRVLQGKFLGGTQAILRFQVDGDVQTFSTNDIVALTFTRGSSQPQQMPAPAAPVAPAQVPAPAGPPVSQNNYDSNPVTLPAGQSLLVRMIDGVDSSKNHVGDIFHASLETDLNVNGQVVARKGTDVYGRLATAEKGGKFAGKSELQLELTRMVIDGHDYPLVSSDYNLQGKGRGGDTAKKVGGGAVLGAVIGAIAGGGKGAAVGAAAGSAAGAGVQIITHGEQVKVPSEALLEFRLQQPVTLTPAG
ncbi:MAG TPA: hypothetical protein VNK47_11975 [Candidatus Dormibacteraeota bacterium]|nr:hypothetical protein [Candidatus Dormibacteraeota bacterium]